MEFGVESKKKNTKDTGLLHRPQNNKYPYYDDLKYNLDMYLRSTNDDLALKFCQDQDAVMLAYLLEYYSRSYMECSWMINVTKILPELSADHMESLYYLYFNKSHFGKMKYNFPIRRDEELPNIYIVPNFTTYAERIEGKICKDIIFDNPFIEAVMTLRWRQAKIYWMIPLIFYIIYIFLFSFLSQLYLSDNDDENKHNSTFMTVVGIFYYVGIYLLIVEFMQMRNYKLNTSFNEINEINNQGIVILLTVTTLLLWIEMGAILSAYYWNTINLSGYNYCPLNDTFNKAKEDGNLGLLTFGAELIDEYKRLDNSFFRKLLHSNNCLNDILEYFNDDKNTLYSCLLVNQLCCEIAVRILWRNVCKFCKFYFYDKSCDISTSIITSLIGCLPKESKNLLNKNGINITIIVQKPPLFNYASFCKVISLYEINSMIQHLLRKKPSTILESSENGKYLLLQEILKMLMNQISSFKVLDLKHSNNSGDIIFIYLPEAKIHLENLTELKCDSNICSELFYQMTQLCHNVQSLTIVFESQISNLLTDLISSQNNLKIVNLQRYNNYDDKITTSLIKHSLTLTKLTLCDCNNNLIIYSYVQKFTRTPYRFIY
ncbi:hypothetical protein RhiirA5_409011 [Rhizophagus irregularis]|uniref:Uncharacterized protein n=1 Tax=Rhizophagus irregularis TaxID=588596 RepID=A0A2N0Q6U1_9GLOM|nr:hypothetical protein RhiirA5_409011 [Rhizophagus irregularis]